MSTGEVILAVWIGICFLVFVWALFSVIKSRNG